MSEQDASSQGAPAPENTVKKVGKKKKAPAQASAQAAQNQSLKGLGATIARNEFYRDGYRMMRTVALIQALVIIVLLGGLLNFVDARKEYKYFATTEDGRVVPMIPMDEPNLSTPALMSWVAQSAAEVYTYGHHDYRRRLQEASRLFTRTGWESFTTALEASKVMDVLRENQQVVTAAPGGAPIILSEGVVNGRYEWMVELPLHVTYQAGAKRTSRTLQVRMVIVRVEQLESPHGVGINQWIAY